MLKPVALVIVTGRSTEKRIMVVLVLYDGAAGVLFSYQFIRSVAKALLIGR